MDNIGKFNTAVGLILGELYAAFPTPIDIHTGKYSQQIPDTPKDLDAFNDPGMPDPSIPESAFNWLVDEGYIRCTDRSYGFLFVQSVLTSKGLTLLDFPSSLNPQKSVGSELAEATKKGLLDGVRDLAKFALVEGTRIFLRDAMNTR